MGNKKNIPEKNPNQRFNRRAPKGRPGEARYGEASQASAQPCTSRCPDGASRSYAVGASNTNFDLEFQIRTSGRAPDGSSSGSLAGSLTEPWTGRPRTCLHAYKCCWMGSRTGSLTEPRAGRPHTFFCARECRLTEPWAGSPLACVQAYVCTC